MTWVHHPIFACFCPRLSRAVDQGGAGVQAVLSAAVPGSGHGRAARHAEARKHDVETAVRPFVGSSEKVPPGHPVHTSGGGR